MKRVVIMVGLPGSGKSTCTDRIVQQCESEGKTCAVHSTDSFHYVDGEYHFQPEKLGYYHRCNQQSFYKSVDNGVQIVVVDNTNITARDRRPYVEYAKSHGYEVEYKVVGDFTDDFVSLCAVRNTHGVPYEAIARMAKRIQLP